MMNSLFGQDGLGILLELQEYGPHPRGVLGVPAGGLLIEVAELVDAVPLGPPRAQFRSSLPRRSSRPADCRLWFCPIARGTSSTSRPAPWPPPSARPSSSSPGDPSPPTAPSASRATP